MRSFSGLALALLFSGLTVIASAQTSSPRPAASPRPSPASKGSPSPKVSPTASPKASPTPKATPSPSPSAAQPRQPAPRPQFRPAVLTSGPDSLVNRINAKELLSKGQKDGAVQFGVTVGPDGMAGEAWTYRRMPGSEALDEEVLRCLTTAKFTPPIYNHQPVTALLYGTVIFTADGPPHVRVLLNQDPEEIKAVNDFIGPQPIVGGESKFSGLHVPETLPVAVEGVVDVQITVDARGNLRDFLLIVEDPPLLGFGEAVIEDFQGVKFIPAFRDGDPTDSQSVMSVCYKPIGVAPEPSMELGPPPEPEGTP